MRPLPRGRFFRDATLAARNESEEHSGLLADAAVYLEEPGVRVRIGVQEQVVSTADAEFERSGRGYNLEVECSNLVKHVEQVVRNVRKAQAARRRCLIAVADRESAERVAGMVATRLPDVELWGEVGLLWRARPRCMVPYPAGERDVWGWLLGREEDVEPPFPVLSDPQSVSEEAPSALTDDQARVQRLMARVARLGNQWATARDLLDAAGPGDKEAIGELRIGRVMASLGVPHRRVRSPGGQIRLYHIGSIFDAPE